MSGSVERIEMVAAALSSLEQRLVFVGGAMTPLYVTDPAVTEIRPTVDIDVVVEVGNHARYAALEEEFRRIGFQQVIAEGVPLCRWRVAGVLVDLIPTSSEILGFTNRWYTAAFRTAMQLQLASGSTIYIIRPEYFVGTKLEAFRGRGNDDFILSPDIEDVITVIDGRAELVEEICGAEEELRVFIRGELKRYVSEPQFCDAVQGHVATDAAGKEQYRRIFERIHRIIQEGI